MILSVATLDQLSKYLIRSNMSFGESVSVSNFLHFTYVTNDGGLFGFFDGHQLVLTILTSIIIVVAIFLYDQFLKLKNELTMLGLGFMVGGAIGNLIDRIYFGKVTDFIDIRLWGNFHWATFNLADAAITIGMLILLYFLLRNFLKHREKNV
jgi:signal peptidase II